MSDSLVTLPHGLKILYEAAADENLDRGARELAVGTIVYTISPNHLPGVQPSDFVNYCDGAILVKVALQRIGANEGEDAEAFRERFIEFYQEVDDHLDLCKTALGDTYNWLTGKIDTLNKQTYKGKSIATYIDDDEASEFLYEEGLAFATEYDVDEDTLCDRLKKSSTIIDALAKRRRAVPR